MSKRKQPQKKNSPSISKTIGMVLFWIFLKIPYYIFIWLCFLIIFANMASLIGGFIMGDFGGSDELSGTIGSIILVSLLLFILSIITRNVVRNTFEFFMFGNSFGVPAGLVLITALILIIFVSFLQLFHIKMNAILLIVLIIGSLFLSFPTFKRFAKWYRKQKERMLAKENEKKRMKNNTSLMKKKSHSKRSHSH